MTVSYDRQIDQLCPHLVTEELLLVRTDGQTVIPLRPIASANSVTVRLNGELDVPFSGVHLPAQSGGTKEGPFDIVTGVNNILALQVNSGVEQVATLPTTKGISAQKLAISLNAALQGVQFYAERNFLKFRSSLSGHDATIYIKSGSTLAGTVGVKSNRLYQGKQIVPGWSLINDPNTLQDRPTRLVIFDEALRGYQDFAELNYTTIRQECRRCGGIGTENDWRYDTDGKVIELRQESLLIQELTKVVYTARGSNPFHPWYGTLITEQIGQKITSRGLIQSTITADVKTTFTRWQSIKRQQEENSGQFVSDEEYPFRLNEVLLEQSQRDPTVMFVTVNVQNRSLKPVQLTRGLRLPTSLDLLGLNTDQRRITLSEYSSIG